MNVSNTTLSPLVAQGQILVNQSPFYNHFRFCVAVPGSLANIMIIFVVVRSKQLHTTYFAHTVCLAVADFLYLTTNAALNAMVVFPYWLKYNTVTTTFRCNLSVLGWFFFSVRAIGMTNLALALDRWIAIQWPVKYKTFTWRYVLTIQCVGWIYSATVGAKNIVQAADNDTLIALCTPTLASRSTTLDNLVQVYLTNAANIGVILLLIASVISLARTRKKNTTLFKSEVMQVQVKALKAVGVACGIYFVAIFFSQFASAVSRTLVYLSNERAQELTQWYTVPHTVYSSCTIVVYLVLLAGFRNAFLSLVCRRKNVISTSH